MKHPMDCKFKVGSYYKDGGGNIERVVSIDMAKYRAVETNVNEYLPNGSLLNESTPNKGDLRPIEVDHNGNILMECKFKVGSYYKDRSGNIEQVESIDFSAGKIETNIARYHSNGHFMRKDEEGGLDLVPIEVDQHGTPLSPLSTSIRLEVGKQYNTANDTVYKVWGKQNGLFIASISRDNNAGTLRRFNADGTGLSCGFDLVKEYKEPQVNYINVYREYIVGAPHMTRAFADAAAATQKIGDRIACIKITEGQFDE